MANKPAISNDVRSALARWIADAIGEQVSSNDLEVDAPAAGGWSNDTWFVRFAEHSAIRLVVRLKPEREAMFPAYDLGKQCRVMRALIGKQGVPVPEILALDLQGERLGRPAFIMEYIGGRVPSDNPPTFAEAGWLFEATAEQQRQFHVNLISCMAAVHSVDLHDPALEDLVLNATASPVIHELNSLQTIWDYDLGPAYPTVIDESLQMLRNTAPRQHIPAGLVWGDARPANVICSHDSFDIVALLDWELAGIGAAESEITWLLEMNWVRTEGAGLVPLPGFLSPEEGVDLYQAKIGRELKHLDWFAQLAATRVAILMHRFLRTQVNAGTLDEHHKVLTSNSGSRRVEHYVGLGRL